ncbi:TetR/AcrR family transcriptional regulator, partial [Rhodococcus hoagii]|nr:TetR/AcrR family transcriptional regulator [Prescottella equi]
MGESREIVTRREQRRQQTFERLLQAAREQFSA